MKLTFDRFWRFVKINLANTSRIYQNKSLMQPEERQHRIGEYLQQVEFAALEHIAKQVSASLSTVRRDLAVLEATGMVQRTHGGARIVNPRSDEFTFLTRDTHQLAEKEAIGRACAELIKPNQSVILDAGTTVYHVARYLESKAPQIITNSLPVANLFASANRVEVVVSGGVIYPRLGVLVGPLAVEAFSKIHADVAIMSAGGVSAEGVTNSHGLLIDIQHAMIKAAQKVIFCFDHTKLGRQSVSALCDLDCIDTIVTDHAAPVEIVESLRSRNVEVIVAPAPAH
jgi:DeoR/GlpR family transcriptional regulator of sugar metabolism